MSEKLLNLKEMAHYLGVSLPVLTKYLGSVPHEMIDGRPYFQKRVVCEALAVNGPAEHPPEKRYYDPGSPSVVYLIHAKGTHFYKIGFSLSGAEKRIQSMQTSCPHELVLLSTRPGDIGLESLLHTIFSGQRVRGEWFRFREPQAAVIEKFLAEPLGW